MTEKYIFYIIQKLKQEDSEDHKGAHLRFACTFKDRNKLFHKQNTQGSRCRYLKPEAV